jgi:hypothetical protein
MADAPGPMGLTTDEKGELSRLRGANGLLREDLEIVKTTTAFSPDGDPLKARSVDRGGRAGSAQQSSQDRYLLHRRVSPRPG